MNELYSKFPLDKAMEHEWEDSYGNYYRIRIRFLQKTDLDEGRPVIEAVLFHRNSPDHSFSEFLVVLRDSLEKWHELMDHIIAIFDPEHILMEPQEEDVRWAKKQWRRIGGDAAGPEPDVSDEFPDQTEWIREKTADGDRRLRWGYHTLWGSADGTIIEIDNAIHAEHKLGTTWKDVSTFVRSWDEAEMEAPYPSMRDFNWMFSRDEDSVWIRDGDALYWKISGKTSWKISYNDQDGWVLDGPRDTGCRWSTNMEGFKDHLGEMDIPLPTNEQLLQLKECQDGSRAWTRIEEDGRRYLRRDHLRVYLDSQKEWTLNNTSRNNTVFREGHLTTFLKRWAHILGEQIPRPTPADFGWAADFLDKSEWERRDGALFWKHLKIRVDDGFLLLINLDKNEEPIRERSVNLFMAEWEKGLGSHLVPKPTPADFDWAMEQA